MSAVRLSDTRHLRGYTLRNCAFGLYLNWLESLPSPCKGSQLGCRTTKISMPINFQLLFKGAYYLLSIYTWILSVELSFSQLIALFLQGVGWWRGGGEGGDERNGFCETENKTVMLYTIDLQASIWLFKAAVASHMQFYHVDYYRKLDSIFLAKQICNSFNDCCLHLSL